MTNEERAKSILSELEYGYIGYDNLHGDNEQGCEIIKEALEKQIPTKPNEYEDRYYACPKCYNVLLMKWERYPTVKMPLSYGLPYCLGCGQAIDWSEVE